MRFAKIKPVLKSNKLPAATAQYPLRMQNIIIIWEMLTIWLDNLFPYVMHLTRLLDLLETDSF